MTAADMWAEYSQHAKDTAVYDAWCFGGTPELADKLAALVASGEKTATSSAYPLYAYENEPLPQPDIYSVVLDSKEQAVCIIKTVKVTVVPFDKVTAHHAFCEGEGDKSLAYWQKVHKSFFTVEMELIGKTFDETMPVVCEEFEVVYPG